MEPEILKTAVLTGTKSPVRRKRDPRTKDSREVVKTSLSSVRFDLDKENDATLERSAMRKSADITPSCSQEGAPRIDNCPRKKRR